MRDGWEWIQLTSYSCSIKLHEAEATGAREGDRAEVSGILLNEKSRLHGQGCNVVNIIKVESE